MVQCFENSKPPIWVGDVLAGPFPIPRNTTRGRLRRRDFLGSFKSSNLTFDLSSRVPCRPRRDGRGI